VIARADRSTAHSKAHSRCRRDPPPTPALTLDIDPRRRGGAREGRLLIHKTCDPPHPATVRTSRFARLRPTSIAPVVPNHRALRHPPGATAREGDFALNIPIQRLAAMCLPRPSSMSGTMS
jgi:hypothetical protein